MKLQRIEVAGVDTVQAPGSWLLVIRRARVAVEVGTSLDRRVHGVAEDVLGRRIVALGAGDLATRGLLVLAASNEVL